MVVAQKVARVREEHWGALWDPRATEGPRGGHRKIIFFVTLGKYFPLRKKCTRFTRIDNILEISVS